MTLQDILVVPQNVNKVKIMDTDTKTTQNICGITRLETEKVS